MDLSVQTPSRRRAPLSLRAVVAGLTAALLVTLLPLAAVSTPVLAAINNNVTGTVFAPNGTTPVAGAGVTLVGTDLGGNYGTFYAATTNASGVYQVSVTVAGNYKVTALPPLNDLDVGAFASVSVNKTNLDNVTTRNVTLRPITVQGRVFIEGTSTPVGHGSLFLTQDDGGGGSVSVGEIPVDGDGRFWTNVAPGTYGVDMVFEALSPADAVASRISWTYATNDTQPIRIDVPRPTIVGTVRRSGQTTGLADAGATLADASTGFGAFAPGGVDDNGRFGFLGERGTTYRVVGSPPASNTDRLGSAGVTVTVPASGQATATIDLPVEGRPPYDVARLAGMGGGLCDDGANPTAHDTVLDLSADGSRVLVFSCNSATGTQRLQVRNATTGAVIQNIPTPAGTVSATMDDAGQKVALVNAGSGATFQVLVRTVGTSDVVTVTVPNTYLGWIGAPELAGDGSHVAYLRPGSIVGDQEVAICEPVAGASPCAGARIIAVEGTGPTDLAVSSDASTVALTRPNATTGTVEAVVYRLTADAYSEVFTAPAHEFSPSIGVSADGQTVAFVSPSGETVTVAEAAAPWTSTTTTPLPTERVVGGFGTALRAVRLSDDGTTLFVVAQVNDLARSVFNAFFGSVDVTLFTNAQVWKAPVDGSAPAALVSRLSTGDPVPSTFGGRSDVAGLAVSADGTAYAASFPVETSPGSFQSVDRVHMGRVSLGTPYQWDDDAALTTRPSSDRIRVSWPTAPGAGVRYRVSRTPAGASTPTTVTTTETVLTGLSPSTSYTLTVQALRPDNSVGDTLTTTVSTTASRTRTLTAATRPGGRVELDWDDAPGYDSYEVRAVVVSGASAMGPFAATASEYALDDLPAGAQITFTAYGIVTSGGSTTADAITDPVTVTVPALTIASTNWTVPTSGGIATIAGSVQITVVGEAGRSASALVNRTTSDGITNNATVALTETTAGTYTGTFAVLGNSRINSVTGRVTDGVTTVTRASTRGAVNVEAVVDAVLSGPVRSGWSATVRSRAGVVLAAKQITSAGPQTVSFTGVPGGQEVEVDVTDSSGQTMTRLPAGDGWVSTAGGRRSSTSSAVPSLVDTVIQVRSTDGGALARVKLDVSFPGNYISVTTNASGNATVRGVPSGRSLWVSYVPQGDSLRSWVPSETTVTITGPSSQTVQLVVTPRRTVTISGRVATSGGVIAAGSNLYASQRDVIEVPGTSVTADSEGRYSIEVLEGFETDLWVTVPAGFGQLVVVPAGSSDAVVDVTVDSPAVYEVPVEVFEAGASAPVVIDNSNQWQYGLRHDVGGRTTTYLREALPGQRGARLIAVGRPGEIVTVCADGVRSGQGAACSTVELPAGSATSDVVEIRLPVRTLMIARVMVAQSSGSVPYTLPVEIAVSSNSGGSVRATVAGPDVAVPVGLGGLVRVTVSVPPGTDSAREGWSASTTATLPTDPDGDVVLPAPLVLAPPTVFAGEGNLITTDVSPVVLGGVVAVRAQWNATQFSGDGRQARLTIPVGATLVANSVMVGDTAVPDSDLTLQGSVGSERTATVALSGSRDRADRLSFRLAVADDTSVEAVVAAVSLGRDGSFDPLPAVTVPVVGATIAAPRTVRSSSFDVRGRAAPGSDVTVLVNGSPGGRTIAASNGAWRSTVSQPVGAWSSTLLLSAETELMGVTRRSNEVVVNVDQQEIIPSDLCVESGGRRRCFDPGTGISSFPFILNPHNPLTLQLFVDDPSRVDSVVLYLGTKAKPAELTEVDPPSGSGPRVQAFTAEFSGFDARGPISYDLVARPTRPVVPAIPAPDDAVSVLGPLAADLSIGEVELVDGANSFTLDVPVTLSASGSGPESQLTVAGASAPLPTAAQLAEMDRTGSLLYGLTVSDPTTIGPDTPLEISFSIRTSDLPEMPALARFARAAPRIGAVNAIRLTVSLAEEEFAFATSFYSVYNEHSGVDKYDTLGTAVGSISPCLPPADAQALEREGSQISRMYGQMTVVGIALGLMGAAFAPEGILIAAVLFGAGFALDQAFNYFGQSVLDSYKLKVRAANAAAQQSDDCTSAAARANRPAPVLRGGGGAGAPGAGGGSSGPVGTPAWIFDPSGYVYEGVPSNRIEGVTATLLTAPELPDGSCSVDSAWSFVDMTPYEQTNPLITDVEGKYAWDVPEGCWRVKYELDGYAVAYSDALKVLPPHLDVNIPLTSLTDPTVRSVTYDAGGFLVRFSRPMLTAETPGSISLRGAGGGAAVTATVAAVAPEEDPAGRELAAVYRITPATPPTPGDDYEVVVSTAAVDYAARPLVAAATVAVVNRPAAPTGATVTAGPASAQVSWTAPANDGGAAVAGYEATAWTAASGGTAAGTCEATAPATTCTITGLTNGTTYHVDVTASNSAGASPASVARVAVVPAAPFTASPVPTVSGTATVGSTLTARPGTWTPAPSFAYQWLRDGAPIAGATRSTYTPGAADVGKRLSVRVTGTQVGVVTASRTSAATGKVAPGVLTKRTPTISGTARVGSKLTAKPGTWAQKPTFTYQWLRNGKPIKKATKATYTPTRTDRGKRISVRVTAKKPGYTTVKVTSATLTIR